MALRPGSIVMTQLNLRVKVWLPNLPIHFSLGCEKMIMKKRIDETNEILYKNNY